MSETEQALEQLARLCPEDRGWIVERLSDAAKARLMPAPQARAPMSAIERLSLAQAEEVCAVLRAEPSWLIAAVLNAHPWPWSREVLQDLLPSARAEVSRAQRHGVRLAKPAMEHLLCEIVERVGAPASRPQPLTGMARVIENLQRLRGT